MKTLTDSPLARAKDRLRIHELWDRLGLAGEPSKSCCSPFRPDASPSFSVSEDGTLWNDFAEGAGGDAVDFLARAAATDKAEAARRFIAMAGTATAPKLQRKAAEKRPLPKLEEWTLVDATTLARLRRWPLWAGCEIAAARGLLGVVHNRDGEGPPVRCWAVTDDAREVMQLRRIDGKPFSYRWDEAAKKWNECAPFKAKTLCAGKTGAAWPVGAANLTEGRDVILCEGGPDFLACFGIALLASKSEALDVVGLLGAGNKIAAEALPKFAAKRVRIFQQADKAGEVAAALWGAQLESVGAVVDCCKVTGDGINDASDAFSQMYLGDEAERLLAQLGKSQIK
jgi:hypothetical protein|tara:strand:- start:5927 stop:6949 length:1023 start_codon:yes stop_codon:yes gene_type:complete